jgi:hypothetical protein
MWQHLAVCTTLQIAAYCKMANNRDKFWNPYPRITTHVQLHYASGTCPFTLFIKTIMLCTINSLMQLCWTANHQLWTVELTMCNHNTRGHRCYTDGTSTSMSDTEHRDMALIDSYWTCDGLLPMLTNIDSTYCHLLGQSYKSIYSVEDYRNDWICHVQQA